MKSQDHGPSSPPEISAPMSALRIKFREDTNIWPWQATHGFVLAMVCKALNGFNIYYSVYIYIYKFIYIYILYGPCKRYKM